MRVMRTVKLPPQSMRQGVMKKGVRLAAGAPVSGRDTVVSSS